MNTAVASFHLCIEKRLSSHLTLVVLQTTREVTMRQSLNKETLNAFVISMIMWTRVLRIQ